MRRLLDTDELAPAMPTGSGPRSRRWSWAPEVWPRCGVPPRRSGPHTGRGRGGPPHLERSLHQIFEEHDRSVGAWIRELRLGARWGFTRAASFSRTFRAAYGLPPREYRRLTLSATARPEGPSGDPGGPGPK